MIHNSCIGLVGMELKQLIQCMCMWNFMPAVYLFSHVVWLTLSDFIYAVSHIHEQVGLLPTKAI